jgi:hypothetical protein
MVKCRISRVSLRISALPSRDGKSLESDEAVEGEYRKGKAADTEISET